MTHETELILEDIEPEPEQSEVVQKAIQSALRILAVNGIAATATRRPWNTNADGTVRRQRGMAGLSQILGIIPPEGRFLAIAFPAMDAKGKPYRDQFSFLGTVNAMGGVGFYCTSIDELTKLVYHARAGGKFELDGDKLELKG